MDGNEKSRNEGHERYCVLHGSDTKWKTWKEREEVNGNERNWKGNGRKQKEM